MSDINTLRKLMGEKERIINELRHEVARLERLLSEKCKVDTTDKEDNVNE